LLLAGSWDSTLAGDERLILELAEQRSLRSVDRDLAIVASEPDTPVRRSKRGWQFVDPIDAWDQLAPVISHHDLDLFRMRVGEVLTYRNPTHDMSVVERLTAELRGELPPPQYSHALREGFAETIAILGAAREDALLPAGATGTTGARIAAEVVHDLLHNAPSARWLEVFDVLPELAEAAPSAFLNAIEGSLRVADPPVLALFGERDDGLGLSRQSAHTHLLWALEHLAFSPAHLSRVVVALGLLAELDPGGTLQNRPANSLCDALHLIYPQSAVDGPRRLAAIDALRGAAPEASWILLLALVKSLDQGMILNRGPKYREWPRAEPPTRSDVFEALTAIGERIVVDIDGNAGRWIAAAELATKVPASVRTRLLQHATTVWDQLADETRQATITELKHQVSLHTKYRDSAWALDEDGIAELAAFVEVHDTDADAPSTHLLFSLRPDIDGHDLRTPDGQALLKTLREDAVRSVLPDGIPLLAAASQRPEHIGAALASVTNEIDDETLAWLGGDEPHLEAVAIGLARARHQQDPDWLWRTVDSHADLRVNLLLCSNMDDALVTYVNLMGKGEQAAFWSKVNPWNVPDDLRLTVAQHLANHDRPFSAMNLLLRDDADTFPVDLGLAVMSKPVTGTDESIEVLHSPGYVLRGMLDRLASVGAPTEQLALLEWWYNPALRHERTPTAFNAMLAKDAVLFARLVALTTRSDSDLNDLIDASDAGSDGIPIDHAEGENGGGDGDTEGGHDIDAGEASGGWQFLDTPENRVNAFEIIRSWRTPSPASVGDGPPETTALQNWVDGARAELARLDRTRAGSNQIGHALSGPATDPDGTWPCRAVRDVIEHENDPDLESGIWSGRLNSRGVAARDPYGGGQQERRLAAGYRSWADQVRGTWPRSGALLDTIAETLESEARRQDGSSDELGDR